MVGNSFTTLYNGVANVLKNNVAITPHIESSLDVKQTPLVAVWDTGATNSVISKLLAEKLELVAVSKQKITTAQGTYISCMYYIDLYLPNKVKIERLLVSEGTMQGFDILIGMDVIGKGDFAVTNFNGKTVFTYRYPSCCTLDFTQNSYIKPHQNTEVHVGRNDPCPCGSGKKYKLCCEKNI